MKECDFCHHWCRKSDLTNYFEWEVCQPCYDKQVNNNRVNKEGEQREEMRIIKGRKW